MGVGKNIDTFLDAVTGKKKSFSDFPSGGNEPEPVHLGNGDLESFENDFIAKFAKTEKGKQILKNSNLEPKYEEIVKIDDFEITDKQKTAITKYSSLINYLGEADEDVIEVIAVAIDSYILEKVGSNSRTINNSADVCKKVGKELRQYYAYDDLVGYITVEGKFTGKEYIHHKRSNNSCMVLIKKGENYINVSKNYKIGSAFVSPA